MMMRKQLPIVILLAISLVAPHAQADVAPPPHANECLLLPIGATCYVESRRGVCDWNVHPVDRQGKTCRLGKLPAVDAGDTSTNTAPAPSPEKSDCSFAHSPPTPGSNALAFVLIAMIALFFRRQKHDARARKISA